MSIVFACIPYSTRVQLELTSWYLLPRSRPSMAFLFLLLLAGGFEHPLTLCRCCRDWFIKAICIWLSLSHRLRFSCDWHWVFWVAGKSPNYKDCQTLSCWYWSSISTGALDSGSASDAWCPYLRSCWIWEWELTHLGNYLHPAAIDPIHWFRIDLSREFLSLWTWSEAAALNFLLGWSLSKGTWDVKIVGDFECPYRSISNSKALKNRWMKNFEGAWDPHLRSGCCWAWAFLDLAIGWERAIEDLAHGCCFRLNK